MSSAQFLRWQRGRCSCCLWVNIWSAQPPLNLIWEGWRCIWKDCSAQRVEEWSSIFFMCLCDKVLEDLRLAFFFFFLVWCMETPGGWVWDTHTQNWRLKQIWESQWNPTSVGEWEEDSIQPVLWVQSWSRVVTGCELDPLPLMVVWVWSRKRRRRRRTGGRDL